MSPPVKCDGRKKKSWSKTFWDHEVGGGGIEHGELTKVE